MVNTVLVTGATGLIGSNLIKKLTGDGVKVAAATLTPSPVNFLIRLLPINPVAPVTNTVLTTCLKFYKSNAKSENG